MPAIVVRAISFAEQDVQDLLPTLEERSRLAVEKAEKDLTELGDKEAASLKDLLERQRQRIEKAEDGFDDRQRELFGAQEAEQRQLRADRAHWRRRLDRLDREIEQEPARVRENYRVVATRLEPVGLLTVMLRLVFVLYAEDRDLLPSAAGEPWRSLYEQGYSLRGLYEKLTKDAVPNPEGRGRPASNKGTTASHCCFRWASKCSIRQMFGRSIATGEII